MRTEGISRTQLMALLWAGIMAPAAELLPGLLLPQAGRNSWLSVALAAPLVLASGWLLNRLGKDRGAAQGIVERLGPWVGRGIILLYIVWAQLLLAQRLWSCARRLLSSGNRDGSLWFFLIAAAGMLVWMGRGKLEAFARAGQLFLAALLTTALVVLGLSLGQAQPERLLPIDWTWVPTAGSALQAAGVIGWGLFAAFLLGSVRDQGEAQGWHWMFWGLGGTLLLAGAQAIIIGNLGAGLAMELDNPFFALAKSVGVEGAFQRVESIIAALWTFADLVMGGILVFAVREMGRACLPSKLHNWISLLSVLLAAGGGLVLLGGNGVGTLLGEQIIPVGNLLFGLAIPGLLCLVRQKEGISCEKKGG
ncbi:GerAB/ArcD/ProY family transporter [Lawsonibacter sp. LCP25S3_G6]|uniref:GerAB/ArcD/ProY family transporter n=1 Tax=unclassified Lawsonibacter TaxID=2617946 RepID=UPI003F997F70